MDENEIKAVSEALEQLRTGGEISAETLNKLGGTTQSANKALAGYTQKILGVTGAMGGMAKSVSDGEGSFKSLGGTIVGLTGVVGKLASALPLVGGAAKALAEGVGEASKFILDQLDVMAKNYQTLGDASAGAADGVDGLLRQFNQMGNYSLPAFTKAVKANMAGLAAFKGTAAEGAEELSNVAGALTKGDVAKQFLKLGMSLDSVGDAAAAYSANFGRMGLTQGLTTDELTKKTQNYIYEVDKIARLTGQSREAQQRAQQQTLADARARAVLGKMGREGQADEAKQLSTLMSSFDEATNSAIRAMATGIPLTEQAQKANLYSNDQIRQTTLAVKSGQMTALEGAARIREALAAGAERFENQISYAGDVFGGVAVAGEDASATLRSVAELKKKKEYAGLSDTELVAKAQELQRNAAGKTTEEFVDAQLATAGAAKDLQTLGFTLAKNAIPAVDAFATGLKTVTGYIDEKFGSGKKGGAGGELGGKGWWEKTKNVFGFGDNKQTESNKILDLIGQGESKGNYNALVYGKKGTNAPKEADLTNMTIAQVQEYQKGMIDRGHASTAVGKYQMIAATLAEQVKKAGLDPATTKFNQKTQDLLAKQLVDQAGYGKKDVATVMKNLAGTWASLPKDMSGRGVYDNDANNNRASINPQELAAAIKDPNVVALAGPTTKYRSNLAGDPSATMPKAQEQQTTQTADTTSSDSRSLDKNIAELVALQRQSVALQAKILQQARAS